MAEIEVRSEVAGLVWSIDVSEGDQVGEGDAVVTLECMKMEIPVAAPASGRVVRILVQPGDQIDEAAAVAVIATGVEA